jgi:hypothetical protein
LVTADSIKPKLVRRIGPLPDADAIAALYIASRHAFASPAYDTCKTVTPPRISPNMS